MRRLWTITAIFFFVHALLAGVFCAWLYGTGRVNRERLVRLVDLFAPTVEEEHQEAKKAAELVEEADRHAVTLARLQAVEAGPTSLTERMESDRQVQERSRAQLQRYREDVAVFRSQITGARQRIVDERAAFEAEREAFRQQIDAVQMRQHDEDFALAVQMYERVKPSQAKQMLQELLNKGQTDDVVNYLAAMNLRKAALVLKQFRSEEEIAQASLLLEKLRVRGVDPVGSADGDAESSS